MTMHPNYHRVVRMLERFGGFYTFEDILECISKGTMQSFAFGNSWAVTQICEFPRRRTLDIVFMVGEEKELQLLESDLIGFAREHGIDYMMANGRVGFEKKKFDGWKHVSSTFIKELGDGTENT
jgi:hypothetical protein